MNMRLTVAVLLLAFAGIACAADDPEAAYNAADANADFLRGGQQVALHLLDRELFELPERLELDLELKMNDLNRLKAQIENPRSQPSTTSTKKPLSSLTSGKQKDLQTRSRNTSFQKDILKPK